VKDAETLALVRAVDDVVLRGLAREVDGRYDTARAMAADLEKAVQPAGVSEVSDWVEHFAADALKARAAVVSRIESQSGVDASELADLRSSVSDFAAASQSKGSAARLPPPSGDGSSASAAAPIALVKRSVNAAAVLSDRSSPSSRGRLALVLGGLVVVLAAVGAVARTYAVQPVAVVAQPPSSAVPVVSAASSPPEPWRAPASSAASPAALSASAAPSQHPEQTTGSGDAAVSVPASRPGRSTPHPKSPSPTASAAAPAPNCNPPFTYDADGLKHFKPDCLQ
jgi:serine/threonine-protein kinase